jgi:hypothetical protein
MNLQTSNSTSFVSNLRAAPLEMQAFAIFSLTITVLEFVLVFLGPKSVLEAAVPITGWMPTLGYLFSIYFIFLLILRPVPRWRAIRFGIVVLLLISMCLGVWNLSRINEPNHGNPFLTASPWQPLWTLALPAAWIAVLFSPRIKKFCEQRMELHES